MISGLLFGLGLCLAPFVVGALLAGARWIALGVLVVLALAVVVVVHATGLADWRLVGLAFGIGSAIAFLVLPWLRFDGLRSALFLNAGLIAVSVYLVQHPLPPPDPTVFVQSPIKQQ